MSFWGELRRRNVFRVGIAYLASVWLVIQVADTVLPTLGAPDWAMRALIYACVVLFPFILILAWIYDWMPEGLKVTAPAGESDRPPPRRRTFDIAIIAVMALAIVVLVVDNYLLESATPITEKSVAVLPFENQSPDPEKAYWADGIYEEILNQLAKIETLRVLPRISVQRYADTTLSAPEIGNELDVGTIMEGSVRYTDEQLRVTVRLVDATADEEIWSNTYTSALDDPFAIESGIAGHVAAALDISLSSREVGRIQRIPTHSWQARDLLGQAGVALRRGDMDLFFDLIEQALSLDPEYWLAYVIRGLHVREC